MKKKILLGFMIIVMVFTITGCTSTEKESSSNSKIEGNVDELYFKHDDGAIIDVTANGKRMKYEDYSIIISHQKGKTIEELAKEKNMTFNSTKNINKRKWQIYDFKGNVDSIIYMIEKEEDTYNVTFSHDVEKEVELDNIIEEFMNNVTFK